MYWRLKQVPKSKIYHKIEFGPEKKKVPSSDFLNLIDAAQNKEPDTSTQNGINQYMQLI